MAGSFNNVIHTPIYGSATKTAYTGTPGNTTVPATTQSVMVWLSTAGMVRIGATATAADLPLPANAPIIIPVPLNLQNGSAITVSAIQDAAGGNLYCFAFSD